MCAAALPIFSGRGPLFFLPPVRRPVAFTVPDTEPTNLVAGDTWKWTTALVDYPPSEGWALTYYVTGPVTIPAFAATAGTSSYSVEVDATDTALLPQGTYRWTAKVSLSGEVHVARSGLFIVAPNPATMADGATLSHEERLIPVLEAAIERRVRVDLKGYSVTTQSAQREELAEYRRMLMDCRRTVNRMRRSGRNQRRTARFVPVC